MARPASEWPRWLNTAERPEGGAGHGEVLKGDPDRLEQGQIVSARRCMNPLCDELEKVALDLLGTKSSFANRDATVAATSQCQESFTRHWLSVGTCLVVVRGGSDLD